MVNLYSVDHKFQIARVWKCLCSGKPVLSAAGLCNTVLNISMLGRAERVPQGLNQTCCFEHPYHPTDCLNISVCVVNLSTCASYATYAYR